MEISTITFRDPDNQDEGCAIIRATSGRIVLCLSLRSNGDTEVSIPVKDATKLVAALERAVAMASD